MLGHMVDLPKSATPQHMVLELIARTIVERLHPRRIILIGSRARGDARPDSDYDVVVEFNTDTATAWQHSREIYGFFPDRDWSLNVIARVAGEIERCADDPGTIDWDIAREGRVLYSADGGGTTVVPHRPRRVGEEPSETPPSVRDWVRLAESDLKLAHAAAGLGDAWLHVCFHSQQSAEKYLKALLVRHFVRPERTHDLTELLRSLRSIGVALPGLDADCELLTPYAVQARYRAPDFYDEHLGRAAVAASDRIAAAVLAHI
jgi:HEPN domain-containing protein/predicted nucleotidyltransferase